MKALRKGHLPLLAAVLLSFPVAGADIRTAANPGGTTVFRSDPFQLECWQEGKRIIHQTGLEGMTLGQALEGKTLSFRGKGEQTASVVLIPFEHSLCMTVSE